MDNFFWTGFTGSTGLFSEVGGQSPEKAFNAEYAEFWHQSAEFRRENDNPLTEASKILCAGIKVNF